MKWIAAVAGASLVFIGGLVAAWQLGSATAYQLGYAQGQAASTEKCQTAQLDALQALIDSTSDLTSAAHTASQQLAQTISARQQADARTTREIRNALAATASTRAGCVFDDGVMQQLAAARHRAAEAAASGVGRAVPSPDRADGQQR